VSRHEPIEPPRDIERSLDAVRERLRLRDALRTSAACAALGGLLFVVLGRSGLTGRAAGAATIAACVVAGMTRVLVRWRQRDRFTAARVLEAERPESRNLIVTAEELLRHPDRAQPAVLVSVVRKAADVIGADTAAAVPLKRDVVLAVGGLAVGIGVALGVPQSAAVALRDTVRLALDGAPKSSKTLVVQAVITPPEYTGQAPIRLDRPERIEAVQGSHLRLLLGSGRESRGGWRVRFGVKPIEPVDSRDGLQVEMTLIESGYIAIEPPDPDAADRRLLLPVAVSPDRAPTITIDAPGKDLLLPDTRSTVAVAGSATDDYGLQTLDLRYTKVSGSGEQFEFSEGSIPLSIARDSGRSWKARGELALGTLALAPGDSLIYRIVGRDRRPGDAGLASSDTFFVEIAGPGQVAVAGFELPPDRERYALSQQMIVLKLRRLKARAPSIARAALAEEIAAIAGEQRAVRANFVFLTGGHVEDEEQEAEHSHEIQEGRLENTARQEIAAAIQHMSRAEQGMATISIDAALPPAQAAVDALQRAFGRNRYFLRTLPVRSRVDPSRRLSGELSAAVDWRRDLFPDAGGSAAVDARALLARVLELAPEIRAASVPPAALTALAERAVAIDPSSAVWQRVSKDLLALRDGRDPNDAARRKRINDVAAAIAATTGQARVLRPFERADEGLRSAWGEERRRQ
jgi:hypothetical protein